MSAKNKFKGQAIIAGGGFTRAAYDCPVLAEDCKICLLSCFQFLVQDFRSGSGKAAKRPEYKVDYSLLWQPWEVPTDWGYIEMAPVKERRRGGSPPSGVRFKVPLVCLLRNRKRSGEDYGKVREALSVLESFEFAPEGRPPRRGIITDLSIEPKRRGDMERRYASAHFTVPTDVVMEMLDFGGGFCRFGEDEAYKLKTFAAKRLYQIFCTNEKTLSVPLGTVKTWLGVQDRYSRPACFRKRIVEKSVRLVNGPETGLDVIYSVQKVRDVTVLNFTFGPPKGRQQEEQNEQEQQEM
jgi:hypothetical protein